MTKPGDASSSRTKPKAKAGPKAKNIPMTALAAALTALAKGKGRGKTNAKSRKGRPRRRLQPGQVRARGKGKGARLSGFRGNLKHVLTLMYKPLPSPVRTRLEHFRFRAKFPLMTSAGSSAPAPSYPLLLFRPDRNLVSTFIWGGKTSTATATSSEYTATFQSISLSQAGDLSTFPNWVGANDGSGGFIYDNGGKRSEAIPTPNAVLSTRTRPCYGVCRIRITAGPTVRGSLVYRVMNGIDGRATATPASLYAELDTENGTRSIPLRPGTHHYDFVCPVEDPVQCTHFREMWASMGLESSWLTPIVFSFRDVTWNFMTDSFPEVDYSTVHAVQCELASASGHYSNVPPGENHTTARETALEALGGGGLVTGLVTTASRSGVLPAAEGVIGEVLELAMLAV